MDKSTKRRPVLGEEFDKEIRPLIDIIDKLRKLGIEKDINLPTVIVVGDQSSGKSSIIEAISGVELPRGTGIVTRCPLELQLVRSEIGKEWKAFLTCRKEKYEITNPADIGRMVEREQKVICGDEKDISEELLTLRIESHDAPDLTLIDLPGITRIPVKGQSSDVCAKIKNIIRTYVKNKNAVILCVISSNLDLAVNEALSVANQYDPNKERTIGVLSKPDKADKHQKEDITKLLKNEKFELKKGYVVVKCRSQDDLDNQLSLKKSLENERQFFEKDDYFCHMHPSHFGIPNLAKKITTELKCIIKKTLPDLKKEIKIGLQNCKEDINKLPLSVPKENGDKRIYLNKILNEALVEITFLLKNGKLKDINVYSEWRRHFNEFQNAVINIQNDNLDKILSERELIKHIENSRGREFFGFNNYDLFEKLASEHVVEYSTPAKHLLGEIIKSTKYYLLQIINDYFKHLPTINQELKEMVANKLIQASTLAENNIDMIFDGERLIFTMDNELLNKIKALNPQFKVQQCEVFSVNENSRILHHILKSYLKIVQSRLCDILPITIRQWIHIKLLKVVNDDCLKYVNDPPTGHKIEETPDVKTYREKLMKKYNRLLDAERKIEHFFMNFQL